MDKIFVVIPVYKVEAYLDRCISSILNQTYSNWEIVLVDDGSPDNCPAICDRYAAEYENITVIHQENGGLSAARNAGIRYVQQFGDPQCSWITFIDSDDFVHPIYLEFLYRAAKETGVDISSCIYRRTSASDIVPLEERTFTYQRLTPEEFWYKDRTYATIAVCKLFKASCFEDVLFTVGKLHEDEFTTYKILFKSNAIAVSDAALYHYYFNSTSITHVEWTPRRLEALEALNEQIIFFEENDYRIAYTRSLRDLLQHSIKHLMYIRHRSPVYDGYIKEVKNQCNRAFRLYAKEVGFGKALKYWYEVRIQSPTKRVLGQESFFSFLKRRIKKKLRL